jgi:hypothetical protein
LRAITTAPRIRARQARDDFVLHVEEIGQGLVEPLGPEMIARLRVDELNIDAQAVAGALNAAFENIADVQLAADRPPLTPSLLRHPRLAQAFEVTLKSS